jgi:hypothetical protein
MHSDPSLPQTGMGFSHGLGLVPASAPRGGGFRLAPEGAPEQLILDRGGADASPACARDTGPGSVREFPQFEHGAGI